MGMRREIDELKLKLAKANNNNQEVRCLKHPFLFCVLVSVFSDSFQQLNEDSSKAKINEDV